MKNVNFQLNDRFESKVQDWKNLSAYCREASENWFILLRQAKKRYSQLFTESERNFLNDLFNGHLFSPDIENKITFDLMIDDSILDNLPDKWQIDIDLLKSKVDNDLDAYLVSFLASEGRL